MNPLLLDLPARLETKRLVLAVPRAGEGRELNRAVRASFRELHRWIPWAKQLPTVRDSELRCRRDAADWAGRVNLPVNIRLKSGGTLIGEAGLHHCDWTVPKFEAGYWIDTRHAGNGYGTEAVVALANFARRHLKARRLELRIDARNAASVRVAHKAGFTLEATQRQAGRDNRGRLADMLLFSKIF